MRRWTGVASSVMPPRCRSRCVPSRTGARTEPSVERLPPGAIERAFREQSGRAVAVLVRIFGDIDVAEEAVQEAFALALRRWPSDGLPPSQAGWIVTVARRRAVDRLRREAS